MADVNRGNRPLSPHLQVYRLPLAAITSIMTRITGHALVAGIVLIVWWLLAAVTSPGAFACADWVVPYIGDLIGYQSLHQSVPGIASPRAEVAHTIALRRRKGTATVLEQLARDVTGWDALLGDARGGPDVPPSQRMLWIEFGETE